MNDQLLDRITGLLSDHQTSRVDIEARYLPRTLRADALVTRIAPSPTGFVHIGTVYAALLCQKLASQTNGVYFLRIEDTDKKREIVDGVALITQALDTFGLTPTEGPLTGGAYGPYKQSERGELYMAYALELLRCGRAYPCFATSEDLEANMRSQQAEKVRPGYYGKWALWRNKTEAEVTAALDADRPFVLRFKSHGSHEKRFIFEDALKGRLELPENDLDVPLIKSDEYRLPTYHLAHIVDDYLMQTNLVLRGDEWLPSTPLHIELATALDITPFRYAHIAPISIVDSGGGGKRKLSKRKDPQADVQFWLKAGYPVEAIKRYLMGLASSDFELWQRDNPFADLNDFKLSLQKLAASRAPLLDMAKLEDYCKDYIAHLPQDEFKKNIIDFATTIGWSDFLAAMQADNDYTSKVLSIERGGDKPRKDLAKWEDARDMYGYFFDELFQAETVQNSMREQLESVDPSLVSIACAAFLTSYDPADDQTTWFEKLKTAAQTSGFAVETKVYKDDPDQFKGTLADFAKIVRIRLTSKNRTPDLYLIMQTMGAERVRTRLA